MIEENNALLLIDIQNVYFAQGYYFLPFAECAADNARKVLTLWREKRRPIIHIKHDFGVQDSCAQANEFNVKVAPLKDEIVIEKRFPSAFLGTELLSEIKRQNIQNVTVVGMMTNMCVDTTVRACQDHGLHVTLVQDACAAHEIVCGDEKINASIVHKVFIGALAGIFADVVDTDCIMKEEA